MNLNGEKVTKVLGMDIDSLLSVNDKERIKKIVFSDGGVATVRPSQSNWGWSSNNPHSSKQDPHNKSKTFSEVTTGAAVSVAKRCAVDIQSALEEQQMIYRITPGTTYTGYNHKMFQTNRKPITNRKALKALDAADSLARIECMGLLHPLGDGGEILIDALREGEQNERSEAV